MQPQHILIFIAMKGNGGGGDGRGKQEQEPVQLIKNDIKKQRRSIQTDGEEKNIANMLFFRIIRLSLYTKHTY